MRLLLTGGGTAGHINPALAIANYCKAQEPDSEILFVGTQKGLEKTLVPREGYAIRFIEVRGLIRRATLENVDVLKKYIRAQKESEDILDEFRPDVVVGTGGYVCTPVVKAAKKRGIPCLIHEQNVFPGLAIKMLSKRADVTAISFEETRKLLRARNIVLTGNPLRPTLFTPVTREDVAQEMGFDKRPIVLLFGGSLGAERINDALIDMLAHGFDGFNLIAATGEGNYNNVMQTLENRKIAVGSMKHVKVLPYIYNMNEIFGGADLIVSRAGAITVSEINALGKAGVLIPSPYVAHNHQEYNARYLERHGAATVLTESELSGDTLLEAIESALASPAALAAMSEASRKMGITNANETIYAELRRLL